MQHNPDPMRHVPEEELHAYLDQALSRSQCVEIEHHLAECRVCRAERDGIAALRDRTTALLVAAAPRRIRPRPFAHLSATHVERSSRRTRALRSAAWAASVVAALGIGWGLSRWSGPGPAPAPQAPLPVAPTLIAEAPTVVGQPAGESHPEPSNPRVAAAAVRPASRDSIPSPTPDTPVLQANESPVPPRPAGSALASLGGTSGAQQPVLPGMWRTVAWSETQTDNREWVPRVDGVPVVQVKMRQASQGGRPITLVTQQLANGEMISTVEGPATDVAALLSQQPGQSASAELLDLQATPAQPLAPTAQRGTAPGDAPRTLAIFGSATADSLKAFMLRVK